jgi:threonylcarbamoyladenosine tRNA methylthiotransferase MtaB
MNVYLDTIGCRLNQSEIEKFAMQFRAAGHTIVSQPEQADLLVINTCTVTADAAADSRQSVRHAARLTHGEITLTGCWATLDAAKALALPRVARVVTNLDKDHLVETVLNQTREVYDVEPIAREPLPGLHARTRAFIKVQDGCDNHCTFCITRVARGAGRSRSIGEVVADINAAIAGGSQEVVLTGVHLGSWGQDFSPSSHLYSLVQNVLQQTSPVRLRLSSLEPWDLDESFFSLWQDARLCRHLHLPLQSGCGATLRRMARKTTPESFALLMDLARAVSADMALTTDVIVGFPGETEAEFLESLQTVREMSFAGGHVFTYSSRPGTAAERMPGQVPVEVRKERGAAMRAVFRAAEQAFYARYVGREVDVLWEATNIFGPEGWHLHGLSDNYLRVSVNSPERLWNQVSRVKILKAGDEELIGEFA